MKLRSRTAEGLGVRQSSAAFWWERCCTDRPRIILLGIACLATGCQTPQIESRYEFSRPEMGVPFRIVLYAPNKEEADTAAEAGFGRIAQLNDMLSDYETD